MGHVNRHGYRDDYGSETDNEFSQQSIEYQSNVA
jgi:hypothetical protein